MPLAASSSANLLLGDNLLAYVFLALGGALAVGNGLALVRPPARPADGELRRAPLGRTMFMIVLGAVIAVWALASLLRG